MGIDVFAAALALAATTQAASIPAGQGWSPRGLFVFNGVVLDFHLRQLGGPRVPEVLEDCSNSEWFCARSNSLSLVLPRNCVQPREGLVWQHAGVKTEVVGRSITAPTDYYLADPARPNMVFSYSRSGVGVIYWDLLGRTDFVRLARSRGLEAWLDRARGTPAAAQYRGLVTFESFGNCRGPGWDGP